MARESQRYQVGLIICIMIIVVQLALVFFFWRNSNQLRQSVVDAMKKADDSKTAEDKFNNQVQLLKAMLGVGDVTLKTLSESAGFAIDADLADVKKQYDADMKQFAPANAPENERNYTSILKALMVSVTKTNEALAEANRLVDVANQERDNKIKELEEKVDIATTGQQTLAQQLEAEKAQFQTERGKYVAETQNYTTMIADIQKKLDEITVSSADREKKLSEEQGLLVARIKKLEEDLKVKGQPNKFDVPDGQIVTVNQTQRSVWVNLGSDDGLRAQATFTVYDSHVTGGQSGKPKARIEVTRILGKHQAEARILEDKLTNPILRGDVIYSPAFRSGRSVHFAIVGKLDLNEDGLNDSDLVRNLISMNGGHIDAEQMEDGSVTGSIKSTTRYLILGEEPRESDTAALDGFSKMQDDATKYGVETLKVEEFLDMMGWKPEVETVNLGSRASDEVNRAGAFRARRPPAAANRGADGSAFGTTTEEPADDSDDADSGDAGADDAGADDADAGDEAMEDDAEAETP